MAVGFLLCRSTLRVLFPTACLLLAVASGVDAAAAEAAGEGGLPWEGPLNQIADSISGPVARAVALLAVVGMTFAMFSGAGGGAMRTLLGLGLALAVCASASSWALPLFGFGAAL